MENPLPSSSSFSSPIFAVLMAGGAGTRLWPMSRVKRPKPFLALAPDGRTLLRATLDRLNGLIPNDNRFIVAGRSFDSLVFDSVPEISPERLLFEPMGRDTTACIAWAALEATKITPEATMIVLPSDHWIEPVKAFQATLSRAVQLVEEDPSRLIVLGVPPTEPSSAYGYIEVGESLKNDVARKVVAFREKPNESMAKEFLATGKFLWNAGIFIWKASQILKEIKRYEPELAEDLQLLDSALERSRRLGVRAEETEDFARVFSRLKRISIDRAVLERATNVVVLPADSFHWDDLGSFSALERLVSSKEDSSVINANLIEENASNNYVRINSTNISEHKKLVALVGVEDLVVIETADALLIARKGCDESLKKLVERLKLEEKAEYL